MLTRIKRLASLRLARFLGIPAVNGRLDRLERLQADLSTSGHHVRYELDEFVKIVESNLFAAEVRLKDYIDGQTLSATSLSDLEALINDLKSRKYVENDFLELRINELATAASDFTRLVQSETLQRIEVTLSSLRRQLDYLISQQTDLLDTAPLSSESRTLINQLPDLVYEAFEDQYRGPEEEIKLRQRFYLTFIEDVRESGRLVVDIGCGRGEWLELLRDQGINAIGLDVNGAAVARCQSKNLNVRRQSGTDYLKSESPDSLGAVTAFQVIEHLGLHELMDFLRCCVTSLENGGLLIMEFPNIEMLEVGAASFWRDPSHIRPLHADLVSFLAQQVGFSRVSTVYPTDTMTGSGADTSRMSAPDVAIIAVK